MKTQPHSHSSTLGNTRGFSPPLNKMSKMYLMRSSPCTNEAVICQKGKCAVNLVRAHPLTPCQHALQFISELGWAGRCGAGLDCHLQRSGRIKKSCCSSRSFPGSVCPSLFSTSLFAWVLRCFPNKKRKGRALQGHDARDAGQVPSGTTTRRPLQQTRPDF